MGLLQFWRQFQNTRDHTRERPHTFSLGDAAIPLYKVLPFSENVQIKIIEPLLVLFLGVAVLISLDRFFGAYIIITGEPTLCPVSRIP